VPAAAKRLDSRAAVRHLRAVDERLGRLITAVGPCRLETRRSDQPFEALVKSVAYQQLNGKAAATIHARLLDLYPDAPHPTPEQLLATADDTLRGVGLSRNKVAAIKDVAARTIDGTVPDRRAIGRLDDQAIVARLITIRGIGPWSVQMYLMFGLGRPDVLPIDDYGVRVGFQRAFGKRRLPTPAEVARHGERWRPHRTVASWYLWRATEL